MAFAGFTGTSMPALRDDFTRADSATLGLSWREGDDVGGSGISIASNRLAPAASLLNVAYWDGIESSHIGFAFTIAVDSPNDYAVCGSVVTADAGNGVNPIEFFLVANMGWIEIDYDLSGSVEATVTLSTSFVSGDVIGFDVEDTGADNVYKFYRRAGGTGAWAQVGSWTDTSAGRGGAWDPGVGFFGITTARIDDFYAEAITAAPTLAQPRRSITRRA